MSWGNDPIVETVSASGGPSPGWGQDDPVVDGGAAPSPKANDTPKHDVDLLTRAGMAANRTAASIITAPQDAIRWGVRGIAKTVGLGDPAPISAEERHKSSIAAIGRSVGVEGAHPDSATPATTLPEKIAEGVGSGAAEAMMTGGAGGLFVNTLKASASFGNTLAKIIAGTGAASNAVLGATSGAGAVIAEEMAPEPLKPTAALLGGVGGGLVGAAAETGVRAVPGLVGSAVRSNFENPNVAAVRKIMGSAEPRRPGDEGLGLRQQVDEFAETGATVPGSEPTMFQLTGDKKLGELERDVRTANPGAYSQVLEEQGVARTNALNTAVDPNADPNAVGAFVRQRLDNIEAEYGANVAKARQEAEARATQTGGTQFDNPADYGGGLQKQLDTLDRQRKAAEDRLWENFREAAGDKPIAIRDFKKAVAEIEGGIGPMAKRPKGEEADILGTIRAAGDFATFRDIGDLRSQITDALRNPQELTGTQRRRLSDVLGKLDQTLDTEVARIAEDPAARTALEGLTADDVALYGQARTATRERKETFGSGAVGDVLTPGDRTGTFAATQSLVPGRLLKRPEDLRNFVAAAGDNPEAMALAQDALAFDMRRTAVKDGILSPEKLRQWSANNAESLRQFPEMGAKFADAGKAQTALDTAIANQKAALETFQTDAVKKFLADKNPRAGLEQAMNTPESFKALVAEVKQDPTALAGLKRLAVELILSKGGVVAEGGTLAGAKEAGTSETPQLAANAVQKFFINRRGLLADIFDKNELANIAAVTADMQRAARTVKIPDQSNTAQDMRAVMREYLTSGLKVLAKTGAGAAGGALYDPLTGGTIGGAIGAGKAAWQIYYQGKVDRAVADMMLHPKVFAEWASKVKQVAPNEATFGRRMRALLGQQVMQGLDMEDSPRSP